MNITINGKIYPVTEALLERNLAAFLREDLMLTGTKIGCDIGVCGSCTVLVNDKAMRSCKLKLQDVLDKTIVTIEGLTPPGGTLHPIQQAFVDCGAIQCGFCTPGMVLSTYALLKENPLPTRQQVRSALKGNLCRCTGYQQIIDAVISAAETMRLSGNED
ncbi:MAG: (2Fe-2S)-binding protein [Candidatus Cloacimonetes bacterium]|nr:(2Fe-2S)-binding protein [Candidatus Cloacimonadota bacterium]